MSEVRCMVCSRADEAFIVVDDYVICDDAEACLAKFGADQ